MLNENPSTQDAGRSLDLNANNSQPLTNEARLAINTANQRAVEPFINAAIEDRSLGIRKQSYRVSGVSLVTSIGSLALAAGLNSTALYILSGISVGTFILSSVSYCCSDLIYNSFWNRSNANREDQTLIQQNHYSAYSAV